MLSKQDNELLCRIGPGTPMGDLMRQYWIPAFMSSELEIPDGPPLRLRLLGEDLIAFRATSGEIGLIQNACPHRGASLFFGRNEEDGLRCVYHGWKFDVAGACVDMPSEPAESNFKTKVRARAYPTRERGGMVWAYMGPREIPPELPNLEQNMLPEGEGSIRAIQRECNWMQALEGDIDTTHLGFLHLGAIPVEEATPQTFSYYALADRAPAHAVVDTDFGTMYGAYRPAEEDTTYWRIANFLFPFYTMTPVGVLGLGGSVRCWVPLDDDHTMFYMLSGGVPPGASVSPERRAAFNMGAMQENTTAWHGRWRMAANGSNDYQIDRESQKKDSYTGITGIHLQDQAITESMGHIYDRSHEHLATSDSMIIRSRRRLIEAAKALRDHGETPPGVDNPEVYAVRTGGVILPRNADWIDATDDLRKAFKKHPELTPTILGNVPGA
jgi:phthalate 4,5-dioxygenase oxygenase subunit